MSITLFENFHALFYAPYYAAFEIGAYREKSVDVEFVIMEGPGSGGQAVIDGAEAVTYGGPMRVLRDHDQNPERAILSPFARSLEGTRSLSSVASQSLILNFPTLQAFASPVSKRPPHHGNVSKKTFAARESIRDR